MYYTYPALRLIQVLPEHPLADSKDETVKVVASSVDYSSPNHACSFVHPLQTGPIDVL